MVHIKKCHPSADIYIHSHDLSRSFHAPAILDSFWTCVVTVNHMFDDFIRTDNVLLLFLLSAGYGVIPLPASFKFLLVFVVPLFYSCIVNYYSIYAASYWDLTINEGALEISGNPPMRENLL